MAVAQKQVDYSVELDSLLGLAVLLVTDVKGGKSPTQVVADAVPALIASLTGLSQLSVELQNRKVVEATVAMKLAELVNTLLG